ncbi:MULTISPECIES: hypothetical protein [unclassified Rhizobium]|uniref:hypothetical protein n=1 Tax=unclassified Rhizobium TaxID=2613769 RepID=UPI00247A707A|nr:MULTISPECIES: hypothetical protein [unclassified Rhizobium]MDH7803329.1 hypothetical protein [Rhizobium sp. AN70]
MAPTLPRWFLYVEAYDGWFMRLVGRLTGEEDIHASACRRLLNRLQPRLHLHPEVYFIGPNDPIPAHCKQDSLIAQAGATVPQIIG